MSVAPLFPQKPEKIVVPTGVSWKHMRHRISAFLLTSSDNMMSNTSTISFSVSLTSKHSYPVLLCFRKCYVYIYCQRLKTLHMHLAVKGSIYPSVSTKQTGNDSQFYVYCAQMGLEKEDRLAAVNVLSFVLEIKTQTL